MARPDVGDALLISQSPRRQLPTLGFIAASLCVYVLLGAFGAVPGWLMWYGVAVFGVVLIIGLYALLRACGESWELRLDPAGVTVRGHAEMPWSDFAEVRITGMRPQWLFPGPLGYRVVAFVGQPGVELPALPSVRVGRISGFSRLRQRWYGTQLLLMPYAFNASADAIEDAVRRFSDVPVRRS